MGIDYSERLEPMHDPRPGTRIVNKQGQEIKLTDRQKNALYRQAKEIKNRLPDQLCTKRETHHTEGRAINKMLGSEFKQLGNIEHMKKAMKAIGADPRDYDTERMRRRG